MPNVHRAWKGSVSSPADAVGSSPAELAASLLPSALASPLMVLEPVMPLVPEQQAGMHDDGLHDHSRDA